MHLSKQCAFASPPTARELEALAESSGYRVSPSDEYCAHYFDSDGFTGMYRVYRRTTLRDQWVTHIRVVYTYVGVIRRKMG